MLDYEGMAVGDELMMPDHAAWDGENRDIFWAASDHASGTHKQFEVETKRTKNERAPFDFILRRLR